MRKVENPLSNDVVSRDLVKTHNLFTRIPKQHSLLIRSCDRQVVVVIVTFYPCDCATQIKTGKRNQYRWVFVLVRKPKNCHFGFNFGFNFPSLMASCVGPARCVRMSSLAQGHMTDRYVTRTVVRPTWTGLRTGDVCSLFP